VNFDVVVDCPACKAALSSTEQEAGECEGCDHKATRHDLRKHIRFVGLQEADERLAYVYETILGASEFLATAKAHSPQGEVAAPMRDLRDRFFAAMADDLNTAAAVAELSEALSEANRLVSSGKGVAKDVRWRSLRSFVDQLIGDREAGKAGIAAVLGVFERDAAEWLRERRDLKALRVGLDVARTETLVAEREAARVSKDWETADRLRDALGSMGVTVRDGAEGSSWTL
jgi:cysteinyl-tRNA synthetase